MPIKHAKEIIYNNRLVRSHEYSSGVSQKKYVNYICTIGQTTGYLLNVLAVETEDGTYSYFEENNVGLLTAGVDPQKFIKEEFFNCPDFKIMLIGHYFYDKHKKANLFYVKSWEVVHPIVLCGKPDQNKKYLTMADFNLFMYLWSHLHLPIPND